MPKLSSAAAHKAPLPFMSVVMITYNGATTIGQALQSLLAQDYPKGRYEVIVVDDGSTDNTASIAMAYPVRYYYQPNGGISRARNAGLKLAKGDIYVAYDDDCVADSSWLRELAAGYQKGNPAGVGGVIMNTSTPHGLTQHYMDATMTGPAPTDEPAPHKSLPRRLLDYWLSNFKRTQPSDVPDRTIVEELYGANGSFPIDVLKTVGGWSAELSGIEDRALCKAICYHFPDRPFYSMGRALIRLELHMSRGNYLLRPWKRGPVNWAFHRRYNMLPPLFPLPFLYAALVVIVAAVQWPWLPVAAVVIPQLLYLWWPFFAIQKRRLPYLAFPYLQLAEESMVIAGLIRGALREQRKAYVQKAA